MANGIQERRSLYATFSQWLEEAKIPTAEMDRNKDGTAANQEVAAYVLSHFEKFSPKVQKEIESLQKAFRALGFSDDEAKKILTELSGTAAQRLLEAGANFEKTAAAAQSDKNAKQAERAQRQAGEAYRMALRLDPENVEARVSLAKLDLRQGDAKDARLVLVEAIVRADAKGLDAIVAWLETAPSSFLQKQSAVQFVAKPLVEVCRYGEAKRLYVKASAAAAQAGNPEEAEKYREKAWLAAELESPYRLTFDPKAFPEMAKLYEALRSSGVPSAFLAGETMAEPKGKHEISGAQILQAIDGHPMHPGIQHGLEKLGLWPPPWEQARGKNKLQISDAKEQQAFEAWPYTRKISFYYAQQARLAKTEAEQERCLSLAAHFSPSADLAQQLGDFYLQRKDWVRAAYAYQSAVERDPQVAAARQGLKQALIEQGAWDQALKFLNPEEGQALVLEKLQEAGKLIASGDSETAKPILAKCQAWFQETVKAHPEAVGTDPMLRVEAQFSLHSGAIAADEGRTGESKPAQERVIAAADQLLKKNPYDESALLWRAEANRGLGNFKSSLVDARLLAKLSPQGAKALADAGLFLAELEGQTRDAFRAKYQDQLKEFQRFANADTWEEKKKAFESLSALNQLSQEFFAPDWPHSNEVKLHEDYTLVRDFYTLRAQYWTSLGSMPFEGVTTKPSADMIGVVEDLLAQKKKMEDHQEFLSSIHYADQAASYAIETNSLNGLLEKQRERLIGSLEPKDKCADPRAQLTKVRLAIQIDLDLGKLDYDHIVRDFEAWQKVNADAYTALTQNAKSFFENWQASWEIALKLPMGNVAGGVFEPEDAILKKLRSVLRDPQGLKTIQEAYAKTGGPAWDQAAFDQLLQQLDEGFDVTKLKQLTPYISEAGLKAFFTKNERAKNLMAEAETAAAGQDLATSRGKALEALKIYGELGNASALKKTIHFLETKTPRPSPDPRADEKFPNLFDPIWESARYDPQWSGKRISDAELKAYYFERAGNMDLKLDEASYATWRQRVQEKTKDPKGAEIASARDSLELYWGMAQALKGTAISLPKEDLEHRQQAFRKERDALKKKYPDTRQDILDALMGPRRLNYEKTEVTFEDWMLEEARLQAADLNVTAIVVNQDAVSEFGDKGRIESDLTSLLLLKSFYEWDGNQPQARRVDTELKHNMAFDEERARAFIAASQKAGSPRPSPKERVGEIERIGKILEADLILYRNLDLSKVEERTKFSIQVVSHLALLQQAVEANRDLPATELLQVTQDLTILTTSCKAFTESDTPIIQKEGLEGTVAAVAKLGTGVLQGQSLLFYTGLPDSDAEILAKIQDLSPGLQGGILGYYFDRAKQSEFVRAEPLTEADWAAIEDIQKNSTLVAENPDQQIEQYLRSVGKFRPLNNQKIKEHDAAMRDFSSRWEEALQKGDTAILANLNATALRDFAARHLQAEQALAAAKQEVDFEKRLDRLGDAAQQFAELGLSKRVEEALAPVIENANSLQDKTQRGEWYLKLAHFYETTGSETRARDFYQQLSQLDPGKEPAELHQMAVYAKGVLELLKEKPATDEAKLILSEIRDFPLAKEKLEAIDRDQHQRWVAVPYSFLAGILMAKVDSSQKIGGGGYALDLERKDEDFRIKAQAMLNELSRLCQPGGECQSLHQAMRKLKNDIRFVDVFVYLESAEGGGKDILAYIETMGNPALTDKQMAGESLRLAEKLLDRENFDLAMQVSAMLKSNPYVTEQAKALVESRIPDAVKWKARKEAIWAAVKDILIVPAIVEGRYQDAGISALTTLLTFGVGKIFASAAKVGWAAWSVRSLEVGGKVSQFAARFAAASPRLFRATEVVVVGLADNMGNVVGGRIANSFTGRESHVGFWHEFGLGILPFAGIHATGTMVKNLGKRAEQITLLRATSEAEVVLLKSQGKLALRTSARVGMEVVQQGGVAFSFAAGDWLNEKIGLAEEQNTPFGWRLFEKLPMSVQQWYGTRGVNFLSGGRLHYIDHVSDQRIQVAAALAKLQVRGTRGARLSQAEQALVQAQHEAMETYLIYYADAAGAKRGKPLSSKELAEEIGELNRHAQHLLSSVGLKSGPAFEAARLNLFTMAAQEGFSKGGDPRTALGDYAKGLPDPKALDQAATSLLGSESGSASDRDSLKGMLLMWALEKSKTPDQFQKNAQRLTETAPKIAESLRLGVEGLLGDGALQTESGRRLAEQFLLRALSISERPGQVTFALETFAKQTPAYGQKIGQLLTACGLEGDMARLALVDWVLESGMSLSSLDHLVKEAGEGKVLARFDGKKVDFEVAPDAPTPHEPDEPKPETTKVERRSSKPPPGVEKTASTGHEAPLPAAARSGQGQRVPDRLFETPARDSTSDASPGSRKKGARKTDEGDEVPVARTTRGELDPTFPAAKIQEERPLQPGEYVVYTGEKLSVLSFNQRFNQRQVALSEREHLQFRVDPGDGSLSVAYFGKGDLVIRDAQGNVRRFRGSNPGKPGHFEKLESGETLLTGDHRVKIQSEAEVAAELKARGEIRSEREKIEALRAELEKSRARGDDATKVQGQEKTLAAAELAFHETLAKRQRTVDGESYAEVMPRVVQEVAGRVFDGFFPKDGTETGLFDGQGRMIPEARIELRNQLLAELERRGIRLSTDNAKSVDSILDLALTAKQHEIVDKPGGLTRTQFFELVGELYLHNNPELRIGAAELTHVPMVVAGTLDHYEVAMRGQGKKTRVSDRKALFIAALLHDAGKWDPKIKTETGFTILKTSPFNKTGADIVVPPGKSLQEVLAEQKIDPNLVPLPFDGMVAILVHHDASNVHAEVQRLVKQGLLSPGEGEQAWQAIQYHGFVSSWIMKNSLGGLGIKSHVFDAAFDKNLVPYLQAYQRVSQRLAEKGVPDLEILMQEPQMAADVATMRETFRKLPPYVQALMLGDHQGQIDVAKYMTILSGVPANKDASLYDLFFGESMGNSLMGVLQTHRFEEIFHSLSNGELAEPAFTAAQSWLLQSDPKQAGLAQAILKDPELAASFESWKKTQIGEVTVQDWLKTLKVKAGTANSPEFVKVQKRVEVAFYEFYALGTERPVDWREQAGLTGPPPPLSWEADVARKDRIWGEQVVGRILEYFGLPETRSSLEAMEARPDALGEQARNFHRDLKKFEALVQEYRGLEKQYERTPSPDKRTTLDQKWAEIDALALQLDAAPYHQFEKEHAQEIQRRVRDLEPVQQVLAIAQVRSSERKKLHPDQAEAFHYSIDYTAVENLTQYLGNWGKAPTKDLLRFEGTVADWSVAEKVLAEIQIHPGLKIVKGFQKSADGNSATVTVQVEGEKSHEVEINFRLAEAHAATPLPSRAQPPPPPAPGDQATRPAGVPLPAAAAGGRGSTSRLQEDIPTEATVTATPYGKAYLAMDEVNPDRLEAYRLFAEPGSASALERMPEGVSATVLATRWHPGANGGPGKVEVFLKFDKTYRFRDNAVLHVSLEDAEALKMPVNKDGNFHTVLPQASPRLFLAAELAAQVKPQAQAAVLAFDAQRQQLYRELLSVGMVVGRSGRSYSAREIEQLLYQVLERNQPLNVLPDAVRPKVREYMRRVVAEAMSLFPEAGIGTADHNYFTGESLKKRFEEMDISGDYRFARMLLNQKAGRPIFGEPSAAEQKDLLGFMQKQLAMPQLKSYGEARALLRDRVFQLDPMVSKALQEADPKLRNLVVDALFGDGQTLRVTDPRQAVSVAQFLGRLGFHREFSVSYNLGTQPSHAVLRLGDLTQVAQEPGEVLLFHTHPIHLTDVRGGRRQGVRGNTLVLDWSEAKERSHSALFSDGDIDCFAHEAARLFKAGPKLKLPFYDTENRVYRNWVQHSTGLSEIEVHLDAQGKIEAIKIRSGLYEGVDASGYAEQQRDLQTYIRSKYGVDASIERVAPNQIEASLRSVAEPGSTGSEFSGEGLPGMKEGTPPVQGPYGSWDQVSVRPNWEVLSAPLAQHQVALKELNPNATEFPVYAGDPAKLQPGAGTRLVVQDGIHTEEPIFWGRFRREGNTWVFYPSDNPQAQDITDGMFLSKHPRADGGYVLNDQDRVSLGFATFQLQDGVLVSQEKPESGLQLSLHPDPNALGGARGAPADYIEPVFTHGQAGALPEIFSGNVDYARGIPVHVTPASARSGEVAMATTQGKGKKGPSEDAILKLHGPKGELVVLDIDGIGGLANGDAAAVLAAEAFAAEYGRSGDSHRAWQFANVAIQRFNGEFKAALPKKESDKISEFELAAAKKAGLAAARKMITDPATGISGAMSDGSGAVAVELKVFPPENPGDPHVVKFSWVGDARGMVLRRQSNGEWKWVYRTVDQGVPNRPGQTVAGVDYEIGGEGRTLIAALHPFANVVTNSLGSNPIAKPQGMEYGEIPDARDARGARPAGSPFAEGAALQKGDLALLGSDGFWENFGHTKIILELIKSVDSAEAAVKILSDEAHWRMGILAQALRRQLPEVIPGLYRFERPEGILYVDAQGKLQRSQVLYIDRKGAVYETPDSQKPVDHYKTDHFSLVAYQHLPKN